MDIAIVGVGHPARVDRARVCSFVVGAVAACGGNLTALGTLITVPLQQRLLVFVVSRCQRADDGFRLVQRDTFRRVFIRRCPPLIQPAPATGIEPRTIPATTAQYFRLTVITSDNWGCLCEFRLEC